MSEIQGHYKDEGLRRLASGGYNVAQFVSFNPQKKQRFSQVKGLAADRAFDTPEDAVRYLLAHTAEHSVNLRSFDPIDSKSRPFHYGNKTVEEAMAHFHRLTDSGLHVIVNETVDTDDGGVSGVAFGNMIEFAPHDTPRCVEKPGTMQLTRQMGAAVIQKVYGFSPNFAATPSTRVEFSVHPRRHGYRDEHTIIWEAHEEPNPPMTAEINWPNRFSDMLGDKTVGLIIADEIGLPVPRTTVFNRTVAPFTFGRETGLHESWLRTAPNTLTPGEYTTTYGWADPYEIMHREDPDGANIATILHQSSVDAKFSGACVMGADGNLIIEGKAGAGNTFMVGTSRLETLPDYVHQSVMETYDHASGRLGPVHFEWVYDGIQTWVVQLHRGATESTSQTVYPGDAATVYIEYDTAGGLPGLQQLIDDHVDGTGIILLGDVGVTSHFGDKLRKARIPSKVRRG